MRKPTRGGGPPPLPPVPPKDVAQPEHEAASYPSMELSLSGAIEIPSGELAPPVDPSIEIEAVAKPEPDATLPAVSPNVVAAAPTASFMPPPPPRPRRLSQPVAVVPPVEVAPPPPPPKPSVHRVGVDATIAQPVRPHERPVQARRVEPAPLQATSLFHDNVIEDSAPIAVAQPRYESVWDEEVAILEREVAAVRGDEPARAALLLGAQAAILVGAKHDRPRALQALETSLALSEERYGLYLSRREALTARAFGPALALSRREIDRIVDPKERLALLVHMGVLEEAAGDLPAAQRAFEAAREIDPRHDTTLLALCDLYAAQQSWDKLASTYHALADGSVDPASRGMFRHAAGTIEERGLGKNDLARATYRAALGEDPQNLPALTALSSLALRLEDWGELARTLEGEADLIADPIAQRRLYERAGDLYWERLSDADSATTCFRKAALSVPDAPGPLRRLASVLESIGRWNELVDVFFAELPLSRSPEERAELHHLVGEVNENHLEKYEDAVVAYQAALAEVPDHVASLQALAGLFARSRRLDAVMHAELGEAERITDPLRRASRYLHLGDLAVHVVGDETEATRLYERCTELEPGHRAAFSGLESIYRRRAEHGKLASLYERQAAATTSRPLERVYLGAAARSLLEADRTDERRTLTPSHLARVEAHLRAAQALEVADLLPLFTLADALEDAGQWEPLVGVLAQLGEKLDEKADRIGLLHRAARILELRLGADARALSTYEQILAHDPAHEAALLAVVRLHQRAGRGPLEIEALGRLRDHASTALEGASLSYRIGRIHERRAGDTESALLAYEEALARKPDFSPALRALERLLRRDRRWARLVEIIERQLTAARSSSERAELRHAIGQIEELHLRNLERAEESYTAALREAPGHDPAGAALVQVKEARGDHAGLGKLLGEQLGRLDDPGALVAHLCRLGALSEGPLDDAARAQDQYAQALDSGPLGSRLWASVLRTSRKKNVVTATSQLHAFADHVREPRLQLGARVLVALREEVLPGGESSQAFEQLDDKEPLVLDGKIRRALARPSLRAAEDLALARLLDERARIIDGAGLRALLHLEAACRYDGGGHPRDAGQALEAADHAVNDLIPVLRGVRRIAVQSEQWPAAVALYAHEAELSRDPENQAQALLEAGELALGRAKDPRAALEHFRRLLSRQPLHALAFQRAGEILERAKDWLGIAALWRQRAESLEAPEARAEAWRKKAEVERDRLRDVASALASLRAALDAAPDELESWKAIAPLQEHQRFWQDAIDTYKKIAELSRGDSLARAAQVREAELRERELGDREGARAILETLVTDPADRDAHRRLAGLSERMGRWDEARALWTQLATTRVPAERADALVSLGQTIDRGAQDHTAAAACYEEALALALVTPELATTLEARFREVQALDTFVEAAEHALASSRTHGKSGELGMREVLARIYAKDLARPERAEAQLVACTELSPDDPATFRALGQLLVDTGRPERALPFLHRALDLQPSSPETLRAMGAGLGYTGLRDAPRIFESAAAHIAGSAPPPPTAPLSVRRTLSPDEWTTYFPRESDPGQVALTELARSLEPYAPQLVAELTGERPRGEPVTGAADQTARATFLALGVPPLRLYVDAELGPEVLPCADDALALLIGPSLLEPVQASRLCFEIVRVMGWTAQGETLGAYLRGQTLATFIQAACDEGGDDEVKELRRRIGKALPRKIRKELERFSIPLADAVGISSVWERSGYAAIEELALLLCRDAGVVFESLGYLPGEALPPRGRGVDLVRFLASEDCWRAYRRLSDG
ncbi:MAG: hypothetical protein ABI321_17765 [Polyangia bacterium]